MHTTFKPLLAIFISLLCSGCGKVDGVAFYEKPASDTAGVFNGTSSYFDLRTGNFQMNMSVPLTIEAHIKMTSPAKQSNSYVFVGHGGGNGHVALLVGSGMQLASVTKPDCASVGNHSTTRTISLNRPTHVAYTWDGNGTVRLYIDGVGEGFASGGGPTNCAFDTFSVGALNGPANLFTGVIDNVRVSRSLVYTSDFTPPRGALSKDASTMILLNFKKKESRVGFGELDFTSLSAIQTIFYDVTYEISPFSQ